MKRLWRCPACGRGFANRNQPHACGHHTLAQHFAGKPPAIRALFREVVAAIRAIGPVRVIPEKTRIAFQVRMSFAQVTPRQRWLDGHVVLARRVEHPRFRRVETFSPRNHLHTFRISDPSEIDDDFRAWLAEAYQVGAQRHLRQRRTGNGQRETGNGQRETGNGKRTMTVDDFRRIALGMKDAVESAHMGHPDFRVNNKIFATLHADMLWGMVKLTPEQQEEILREHPAVFKPESGAWGRQGCTAVKLDAVNEETLGEALTLAWQNLGAAAKSGRRRAAPRNK